MAAVSIDIPAGANARVKAAVVRYGPQAVPPQDLPQANGEPKAPENWTAADVSAVLKAILREHVKNLVKSYEAEVATVAAQQAAIAKVDAEISIT